MGDEETMMGRVIINQNSVLSNTELSNIFIDEYLADANDAEIKVYLYLLRMMCAGMATSVADLADKFNFTEKDVLRALSYWETQGLMSLEHDNFGQLTGIHMQDIVPKKRSAASNLRCLPPQGANEAQQNNEAEKVTCEKPVKHKDNPQMLFVAEQYFGRTLNTNDIKTIYYIQDNLDFSEDLLDYLLQHCVSAGKKDFDYVRKIAMSWHEKGITTPDEARRDNTVHRNSYTIMRELGMQNAPTQTELRFFDRWQTEFGFSLNIITEACRRTVLQTQTKRIQYCDGILRKWHESGAKTLDDIKKLDETFAKTAASRNNEPIKFNTNKFGKFKQNDYNLDNMESQLLDN